MRIFNNVNETINYSLRIKCRCKSYLANKLYNFGQIFFFLKNFFCFISQGDKIRFHIFVIGFQYFKIFGETERPVYRREMFALSELLVQTPEHLDNTKCGRSDGI